MDHPLLLLTLVLALVVALDLSALRWGHDSRPRNDRRRDW